MRSAPASSELLYFTGRGSGPPLLLVHGLMVTGKMFRPVIDHLSIRHRVIVPDLRDHGRSRGLTPPYTAVQLASDLSRLLDHPGIALPRCSATRGRCNCATTGPRLLQAMRPPCARMLLSL
jgi:pimeloyl-ACP methyl ester carboxylesterase